MTEKERIRLRLEQDMERFFGTGGKVEEVDYLKCAAEKEQPLNRMTRKQNIKRQKTKEMSGIARGASSRMYDPDEEFDPTEIPIGD